MLQGKRTESIMREFSPVYTSYCLLYYDYHANLRDSPSRIQNNLRFLRSQTVTQNHSSSTIFTGTCNLSKWQYISVVLIV